MTSGLATALAALPSRLDRRMVGVQLSKCGVLAFNERWRRWGLSNLGTLHRLAVDDPDFRELCQDYGDMAAAL